MKIMCKDIPVVEFHIDTGIYKELVPQLVPYQLRGALTPMDETDFARITPDKLGEYIRLRERNRNAITHFFASRMLNLDRENAKKLLNAYHFSQAQDDETKARIAIACKAISMTDDYWILGDNMELRWDDLNPRKVPLNQIVAHIALTGSSFTLTGIPHTPELTGQGTYAKCWIREAENTYLLKKSSKGGAESETEVLVSNILDHTNVPHIIYEPDNFEGSFVCRCKNMASEALSLVSAEDIYIYCNRGGIAFLPYLLQLDADNIYKMCIIDYLTANPDRHMRNYGCYMNNETGELVSMHPLFDHNNAFDEAFLLDTEGGDSLIFKGKTQRQACIYALKHCDFQIEKTVESAFTDKSLYKQFKERALSVGISFADKLNTTSLDIYYNKLYAIEDNYLSSNIGSI